jgi:hypothetical protein
VILEMAADLESLYEHYRERGVEEDEAIRLAEARLLATPEVLQKLVSVHTTAYQRWLGRAARGFERGTDLLLFTLGVLPVLLLSSLVALRQVQDARGGAELWAVVACGGVVAGVALWKAYQLLVVHERSVRRLHRGLPVLLGAGVAGGLLGCIVFLLALHGLATRAAGAELHHVADRIAASGTVFALGLLLSIGAGLVWFVLAGRIAKIEREESALLLAE